MRMCFCPAYRRVRLEGVGVQYFEPSRHVPGNFFIKIWDKMNKSIKETVILLMKGGAIGVANIIPGVSGGTLAVILGIYDRLIESISKFFTNPEKRGEYIIFLVKIFSGAIIALLSLANVMDFLLHQHYQKTMFLFMGLILGGIPAVVRSHGDMKGSASRVFMFIFGFLVVLALSLASNVYNGPENNLTVGIAPVDMGGYLVLLLAGFLAGGAMIVPGISGSFILVLLGQYAVIIASIKAFAVKPLLFVGFGACLGILLFSKIIELCLEKAPAQTYYFILGLILASFYKIFPGIPEGTTQGMTCLAVFLAGVAVSFFMSKISDLQG